MLPWRVALTEGVEGDGAVCPPCLVGVVNVWGGVRLRGRERGSGVPPAHLGGCWEAPAGSGSSVGRSVAWEVRGVTPAQWRRVSWALGSASGLWQAARSASGSALLRPCRSLIQGAPDGSTAREGNWL